MELIVLHNGEEVELRLERREGGWSVSCGDRQYEVEIVATGPHSRSLRIDGRQYEAAVLPAKDDRYRVTTARGSEVVEVMDPLTHLAQQARGGAGARRTGTVDAYMPGRVSAILVEEGAQVQAGQGVVVLEAMKMENEIQAEHDGVVSKIYVSPGEAVEGGDPLFELS